MKLFTAVWVIDSDAPIIFVAKTENELTRQIAEAIRDGYEDMVGKPFPYYSDKAVDTYFTATKKRTPDEYIYYQTVELT